MASIFIVLEATPECSRTIYPTTYKTLKDATDAINPTKCILRHIDNAGNTGRLLPTEPIGCTPGMRFSLRICAPNFVFDAGDNLSILLLTKPAFTAVSHPNPLITSCRKAEAA